MNQNKWMKVFKQLYFDLFFLYLIINDRTLQTSEDSQSNVEYFWKLLRYLFNCSFFALVLKPVFMTSVCFQKELFQSPIIVFTSYKQSNATTEFVSHLRVITNMMFVSLQKTKNLLGFSQAYLCFLAFDLKAYQVYGNFPAAFEQKRVFTLTHIAFLQN